MASEPQAWFHPSAIVDDGATIGAGTKVWHFCHLMPAARIGKGCVLGQNCYVGAAKLGDGVRVQNNVSLYDGVVLEDHVFPDRARISAGIRAVLDARKPAAAA